MEEVHENLKDTLLEVFQRQDNEQQYKKAVETYININELEKKSLFNSIEQMSRRISLLETIIKQ